MSDEENSNADEHANMEDRIVFHLHKLLKKEVNRSFQKKSKQELTALSAEACSGNLEEMTASAVKRARKSDAQLKKVGNQKQWKHKQDVLDEIERKRKRRTRKKKNLLTVRN